MRDALAGFVLALGVAAPGVAAAQADGGAVDAAAADAATVDAAAPDATRADAGRYPPPIDDNDGCDCRTAGAIDGGATAALIAAALWLAGRRR